MELGIYGLGRMGANMTVRLVRGGHRVVASNRSPGPVNEAAAVGAVSGFTIEEMVSTLQESPRIVWMMVPCGQVTDDTSHPILGLLKPGDIIIAGGYSDF